VHTKLTLRLDHQLIGRAKSHARRTGKSVSQLVADYFALLDRTPIDEETALPPLTNALYGALAPAQIDETDYRRFLDEKYR